MITPLPTVPSRNASPDTFADDADAFLGALPTFRSELNTSASEIDAANAATAAAQATATAAAATATTKAAEAAASAISAINTPGSNGSSTTSLSVADGSKSFPIQTGKDFVVGQFVVIAYPSNVANYMHGQISAYNSGTGAMTVLVTSHGGSGTYASWLVSLTGPKFTGGSSLTSIGVVGGDISTSDGSGNGVTLTSAGETIGGSSSQKYQLIDSLLTLMDEDSAAPTINFSDNISTKVPFAAIESGSNGLTFKTGGAGNMADALVLSSDQFVGIGKTPAAWLDYDETIQIVSSATTMVFSNTYVLTASATYTLPASPYAGNFVKIINRSNTTSCIIGRNSENIMGKAEDMKVNTKNASFTLVYVDTTRGWVII